MKNSNFNPLDCKVNVRLSLRELCLLSSVLTGAYHFMRSSFIEDDCYRKTLLDVYKKIDSKREKLEYDIYQGDI